MPDTIASLEIRGLTVRQPWACAIAVGHRVAGHKSPENRRWRWETKYRALLAIHAGLGFDQCQGTEQYTLAADAYCLAPSAYTQAAAILAIARLADCHRQEPGCCKSVWAEVGPETLHLVLKDIRALPEPIPGVRGALGLWRLTPGVREQVLAQLAHLAEREAAHR